MPPEIDRAAVASSSEDGLLLRGLALRTAGEVAASSAAVALAGAATSRRGRGRLASAALSRLHGFGEMSRLLSRPVPGRVDLAVDLGALCLAVGHGRSGAGASRMLLDLREAWTTGVVARRLLMIAAGLVEEAVRLALQDRAGRLRVALRTEGGEVALTVEDDGPGPRLAAEGSMDGMGRAVAAELVGRGDGTLTLVTGRRGTRVTVSMATGLEDGDDLPF